MASSTPKGPLSQAAEARWEAVQRLVSEGVCLFTAGGALVRANLPARQLLELPPDGAPGAEQGFCHPDGQLLPANLNPVLACLTHGLPSHQIPVCWRRPDDRVVPLLLSLEPVGDGGAGGREVLAVVRPRERGASIERQLDELKAERLTQRHLLDLVFDNVDSGIAVVESGDRLALWNSAFEDICGARLTERTPPPTMTELLAELPWDMTRRQRERFNAELEGAQESFEPVSFDVVAQTEYHRVYTCRLAGGRRLWAVRDLSERQRLVADLEAARDQAEADRHLLQLVFANVESGIVVVSADNRVVAHNPMFRQIWGLSEEWLVTEPDADALGDELARQLPPRQAQTQGAALRRHSLNGTAGVVEVERLDGRVLLIYTAPLGDGRRLYSCRDLTESRQLQASLRARNEELALALHEQEESHRQLLAANVLLAESDRLKSEFLANTSHELRTPLNSILGYLGLITDGLYHHDAEARQFAATAQRSAEHLLALIKDLLDVARIESGRLELRCEPLSIGLAIEEVCDAVRPAVEAKGLALERPPLDLDVIVYADPERLRQVLLNVLDNASKFTLAGEIRIGLDTALEPVVRLSVSDTGIGIPADRLGQVFEKFVQVDGSSKRSFGGTGLGLAICRSLIEMMGGRIVITSPGEGAGTMVTIDLPRA